MHEKQKWATRFCVHCDLSVGEFQYICTMKLIEKFPVLADVSQLEEMLVANIFATMTLENQGLDLATVKKIVRAAIEKRRSEFGQLIFNQPAQSGQIA